MTRWRWIAACVAGTGVLAAAEPDWPKLETHALDLLQRYVRIESVNPPANTRAAAALFKAELERNGFEPKIYESGADGQTNLVVRLVGRDRAKKPLLLLNHFDVVPVDRKAWTIDPFGAIIRDGFLWGRGALDMKGIGVEHLTALIALRQAGIVPARDIVMLSTADEETNGTYGIEWMIANHFDEIDCEYALDEGGLLTREVLAKGKLIFGISVAEKQVLWLRLRAKGTAGHGSQPIADNANVILLEAIGKALAQPERPKGNAVVEEMIRTAGGPLSPNKFTAAIQHNTISLTTLSAGVGNPPKVNVIPSSSEATLDCRLLPGVNADEFVSEIKARINDPRVQVERIASSPDTGASSSKTALFDAIRAVAKRRVPDAVLTPMLVPFATDSIKLRARGILAYGITPMELDAATAATMHSDQERIPVEEFKKGIHFFFDVLRSDF